MKIININPLPKDSLEDIGLYWHTDIDNTSYIENEVVEVSKEEALAFYLSLIHISEPTRPPVASRMPSSA